MPLNIRDPEVDRLATELAKVKRSTKTQAVKGALEAELARVEGQESLWDRLKPLRDRIAAYPDTGVVIDRAFFDELSGESDE